GSKCDTASVEHSVMAVVVKQALWASRRANKHKKAAIGRLADALHELDAALNSPSLPRRFRRSVPREALSRLRAECERIGYGPLPKPHRDVGDKRIAVWEAASLLVDLDRPLSLTRTGEFCRLGAAFYGDKGTDMLDVCRAY